LHSKHEKKSHQTPWKTHIQVQQIQRHNLAIIANQTHQLHKWLENDDIDKVLSNDLWTNPAIYG
jgi:hypothetical protein